MARERQNAGEKTPAGTTMLRLPRRDAFVKHWHEFALSRAAGPRRLSAQRGFGGDARENQPDHARPPVNIARDLGIGETRTK